MILRPCPWNRKALIALALVSLLPTVAACGEEETDGSYRETINGYTVLHLQGTPFEMGAQHARLMRTELKAGLEEVASNPLLKLMFALAKTLKLDELAAKRSNPEIIEECKGMVSVAGPDGWTMDKCLVLNFGDAVAEFAQYGMPKNQELAPGCAQLIAGKGASLDGRLYHARILDWSRIEYIISYPTLIVRRPTGGIPHVVIGFPGNLSPYQGMNERGLVVASNEVEPRDNTVNDLTGESHVQLVLRLLTKAGSLDEAAKMIKAANHMSLETIVVSDGAAGTGAVFEMAPQAVEQRGLSADGAVAATNHFLGSKTASLDESPSNAGTTDRYKRLEQFITKTDADSLIGKLNPVSLVKAMRDRKNPTSGTESPAATFDDNKSLATNGALFQLVFDPEKRLFWLAAGKVPIPAQPFSGFSLDMLLGKEGAAPHPTAIP